GNGIFASGAGTELSVTASDLVTGGLYGMYATNTGTGTTSVSAAAVTGTDGTGINATGSGSDMDVSASDSVSGRTNGIVVQNNGSGSLTIAAVDVTGITQAGISATNAASGTDLEIVAGDASGGINGIFANNLGSGVTTVTTSGAVNGSTGSGIVIQGGVSGGSVTLTNAGAVTGGVNGIYADAGIGELVLDIAGDVTGGDNGIATFAENGTRLNLAAGQTVTGGNFGIATMTRTGSSTSNDVLGIAGIVNGPVSTFEGDDVLTLEDGGEINDTVMTGEGDDILNLADGSALNGAALLGAGDDILNFDGGSVGEMRGGEDTDTLNFNAVGSLISGSGADTDGIAEFEIFNFNNGGYILEGTHSGLAQTNFNAGENIWLGALESTSVTIANGASVQVADGATLVGNLSNNGTLGINAEGVGAFNITGNFAQSADGILGLNSVNAETYDQLIVSGLVTLDGTLALTQTGFIYDTLRLIDGQTGLDGTFDSVTGLITDGVLLTQEIIYDADNFDVLLVPTFNDIGDELVDPDDISSAADITASLTTDTLSDDLQSVALGIALIEDLPVLERALTELRPEASIAGLEVFRSSQNLFLSRLSAGTTSQPTQPVETAALGGGGYAPQAKQGGKYVWGNIQYVNHNQDGTLSNPDYSATSYELAAGVSGMELGDVTFGFALGYADIETEENVLAPDTSTIKVFRAAAVASAPMNKSDSGLNAHVDGMVSFATGTNDINMNVVLPTLGYAATQTGTADIHYIGAGVRLTFDGIGEKDWLIKPHIMVAWDNVYQSGMTVGDGTTAFVTDKGNFDRTTFGYGLTMNHQWTEKTRIRAGLSGYHYVGDTLIGFNSSFLNNSGSTSFITTGEDIRNQYVVESGIEHSFGQGWSLSADAFAEFGDLQGYGGLLKLTKRF
ncbi:autotransporter domain-containing protein, partial [Parasphingorhabdus sp.]